MEYIEAKDIEIASHWIPTYDEDWECFAPIKLFKPYKLFKFEDQVEIDFYIIDNDGYPISMFRVHNGFFVKLPDDGTDEIFKKYDYNLGELLTQKQIDFIIDNIK